MQAFRNKADILISLSLGFKIRRVSWEDKDLYMYVTDSGDLLWNNGKQVQKLFINCDDWEIYNERASYNSEGNKRAAQ